MSILKKFGVTLLGVVLVISSGCEVSILASAGAKLANNQVGDLTADEIRVLSQIAAEAINANNPGAGAIVLNQQQSQALVDFFNCNNVQTTQDFQNLSANAQSNPGSVQCLDQLAAAFQGTNQAFDPNAVTPEQLNAIFGQFAS